MALLQGYWAFRKTKKVMASFYCGDNIKRNFMASVFMIHATHDTTISPCIKGHALKCENRLF